jgi:hypothetical protein
MELFTATRKLKKKLLLTTRDIRCVHHHADHCSSEEYRCTHVDAVWQELEYLIDVCRVTRGAHIEHL